MNRNLGISFYVSVSVVVVFIIIAFISVVWTPYNPIEVNINQVLMKPGGMYLLGTDSLGRDMLSRLMLGSSISITFGVIAAVITMTVGLCFGIVSGFFGGWVDYFVQSVVYLFQGIPGYAFMIAITGILQPSIESLILAIVITSWTSFAQIIRGEVLSIKSAQYIKAGIVLGASSLYIIRYYIIPKILPIIITVLMMRISTTIILVASLSFIGLGIQPPLADWGVMVQEGMTYYRVYPHLVYVPGCAIVVFCGSLSYIGERLRAYYL